MEIDQFIQLVEMLSGSPVKEITNTDKEILSGLLKDDQRVIGHSQLNELLLLVNKDRMERTFFDYFFASKCTIGSLADGVMTFRRMAMLRFGSFIHAYRVLSHSVSESELKSELAEWAIPPLVLEARFAERSPKLIDIDLIPREQTSLVGYLSASELIAEDERCRFLLAKLKQFDDITRMTWPEFEKDVIAVTGVGERPALFALMENYRKRNPISSVNQFAQHLSQAEAVLKENVRRLSLVRKTAIRNQDVYLTWDHMDVYFATSMRKRWEFEDLFDFVNQLMADPSLVSLNLRHFDPTQAFTSSRVNKGLVESLMLKRAKCTIYSVQDSDTLGKDSELAATLAQGKPVIAFVPSIDIEKRTSQLIREDPVTVQDRLRFILYADDQFAQSFSTEDLDFVRGFQAHEQFERDRIWRTIPDQQLIQAFQSQHAESIARLCRMIAMAEARIYDRRAKTLKNTHPLGIQVNLATGVANGVLVVRTIKQCAELLKRVVTNSLVFDLREDDTMWYLEEKVSGCAYRVVSKDRKLTNCFWNFYHHSKS